MDEYRTAARITALLHHQGPALWRRDLPVNSRHRRSDLRAGDPHRLELEGDSLFARF
jgi:hypothetical protein